MESATTGIVICRLDGELFSANDAFAKILGYDSTRDVIGKSVHDLIGDAGRTHAGEAQIKKHGWIVDEHPYARPDGSIIMLLVHAHLLSDQNGDPCAISAHFNDVTDLRRPDSRTRALETIIDQSAAIHVLTNTKGEIEYVNQAFTRISGYAAVEVVGKNPRILKSHQMADEVYADIWIHLEAGRPWHGELLNRKKSGDLYWEYATITPIRNTDGVVHGYFKSSHDITALKLAEEAKDRFHTILHHDIRGPISAVHSLATLGLEDQTLSEDLKEILTHTVMISQNILRLVSTKLTMDSIEKGMYQPDVQLVDLYDLCTSIIIERTGEIKKKAVDIHIQDDPDSPQDSRFMATGSEQLFYVALANLITNAIQASPPRGSVTIALRRFSHEILVSIHNHGAVPVQIRETFFDRFVTANKKWGTGIGTYAAKTAVEAMGGTIHMETSEEVGTTVRFSIPQGNHSITP